MTDAPPPPDVPPLSIGRKVLLAVAFVGLLASLHLGVRQLTKSAARPSPTPAVDATSLGKAPDFSLTSEQGKTVTKKDLLGKVWIADFIFLRCGGNCPIMTAQMASLAQELKNEPDVRFISFDVDPEHDTIEDLANYSKTYKADPARWSFLRGERPEIARIAKDGFKLALAEGDPNDPEPILHSSRFILVDKCGEIRAYHESSAPGPLIEAARKLAKESCPAAPR